MSIDYEKIKRLIAMVEENNLTEISVEEDGVNITIKAEQDRSAQLAPAAVVEHIEHEEYVVAETMIEEQAEGIAPAEHLHEIKSLMTGVFYGFPSPDSPPYVEVGQEIETGQTVGIIEAMKVFSEVPSDVSGRVIDIRVESGKLVHTGDVLMVIDVGEQA